MNKKIMKFSISALALVMLFSGCNKDRDLKAKVGNVEIRAEQVNKEFEKLKKNQPHRMPEGTKRGCQSPRDSPRSRPLPQQELEKSL